MKQLIKLCLFASVGLFAREDVTERINQVAADDDFIFERVILDGDHIEEIVLNEEKANKVSLKFLRE